MQRFFVTFPLSIDLILTDREIIHQLTRVLRIERGEEIVLFDGDGSETLYEIIEMSKKAISLRGKDRRFPKTEGQKNIILYQGMPNKIEKIEYIIQKGVEVGIRKFIFFRSERSQKLILSEAKKSRFTAIAREALEQCGGLVIPEIEFIDQVFLPCHSDEGRICPPLNNDTKQILRTSGRQEQGEVKNIVLDTTGALLKLTEMPQNHEIIIWVGPEGGWSDGEREKMRDYGFLFARFGERVLRTETAGIVTAFALLYA